MERFVRLTAPTGKVDFVFKLCVFMLIGGSLNHLRHMLKYGYPGHKSYWVNLADAGFTTLPMCAFALLLIGHMNSLQKRLYQLATRDPLTGLPNRRWFMTNTPETIASSQALMIVDLDHFKHINDQFGHDVGDRCLQHVSQHLRACLGAQNPCARIGGEEFAAFVPYADDATLRDIAKNISTGLSFDIGDGTPYAVTASVGVVHAADGQSRAAALRCADQATYQAKSRGRACYVFSSGVPA